MDEHDKHQIFMLQKADTCRDAEQDDRQKAQSCKCADEHSAMNPDRKMDAQEHDAVEQNQQQCRNRPYSELEAG